MEAINQYLESLVNKDNTPSISYLLFDHERTIHSYKSGYADILNRKEVLEHTTFAGFSVTKTFTALSILQLAEKGQLSLDDHAQLYLSDFPYSSEITIRQLLTHSAGIPNPLPLKWVHTTDEQKSFDRNSFFKQVFQKHNKVKFSPNEKFAYSNLGYVLLGQIIEQVSGMKYEEYVYQSIIRPLEMEQKDLGFQISDQNHHAKGYQKRFSLMNFLLNFLMDKTKYVNRREGKWISFKDIFLNGAPHGGLIGTPKSFMIYLQELLKEKSTLISDQFKKELLNENKTNSGKQTGMCLSWFKGRLNDIDFYAHAGGGAGYYCEIRIYPEQGIGSVVMLNRTGVKDDQLLSKLDKHYFQSLKQS